MVKRSKLIAALDAHKNRDFDAEKRKKQVKAAEKRKRQKAESAEKTQNVDSDEEIPDLISASHEARVAAESTNNDFANFSSSDVEDDDEDKQMGVQLPIASSSIIQPRTGSPSASEADPESDIALSDLSEDDLADTIPHQRLTINNGPALLASIKRIAVIQLSSPNSKTKRKLLPFQAHNSLVSSLPPTPICIPDHNDDLTRELEFYRIASAAAQSARTMLVDAGVPFTRPADYFAEMVKSDTHMGLVKKKMYEEAASKKATAEARQLREAKKFGKQVQLRREEERRKEKRETLEKIKDLKRKRKGQDTGKVNEDDDLFQSIDVGEVPKTDRQGRERNRGDRDAKTGFKRQKRDQKFGFGGKKRFAKSGDAESTADMRGFSAGRMKGKSKGGTGPKRLGKSRRNAMKG